MQGLQGSQADGQLVDVLGSLRYGQNDLLPVREQVSGARADVQVGEVRFGAWEGGKHPVETTGEVIARRTNQGCN